jgi:hypothetical protein
MRHLKHMLILVISLIAVAGCGGGGDTGGSSGTGSGTGGTGTSTGGTTTTSTTTISPTIQLAIVDASGNVVASNSINSGAALFARATVKDSSGTVVPNKLVTYSTDTTVATLAQSAALTDSSGVTKVQISPVSLTSAGAATLMASTSVGGTAIQTSLDFQTAASNVTLTNLAVASNPINALQSSAVTVVGNINGVPATSSAVLVNFSASCGSFSPASASTNGSGLASTTYQSSAACSGTVTLSAQATGATAVTAPITVNPAAAANVVFGTATVPLLVVSSATSGNRQSQVSFLVLDSSGNGMSGQQVNISIDNAALSAGVTFSAGGVATTATQSVTTSSTGTAIVTVSSGSLPTPLVVTAALASNPSIKASSSGISVTSGKATQNAASLSASSLSIAGYSHDGVQTTLTIRVADRQGNPVPAGAVVNFVTGYGLISPGSCTIGANSQCTVTYSSQGTIRGYNNLGRVAILAYMDGEESFIDQNGDNVWQAGEPFFDMGTAYRDDNENAVYDAATEQTYPGGSTGSSSCAGNPYSYPSVANTCDGTWSSSIRVRKQIVIVLATDNAVITRTSAKTVNGFNIQVADANGNAMATGTTVAAAVTTSGSACSVNSVISSSVLNTTLPTTHTVTLNGDPTCATASVLVTVTSAGGGLATVASF